MLPLLYIMSMFTVCHSDVLNMANATSPELNGKPVLKWKIQIKMPNLRDISTHRPLYLFNIMQPAVILQLDRDT